MNPTCCLFGSQFVCAQTAILFWQNVLQKLFFGLRLVSRIFYEFLHPAVQTKIVQQFGGFFHQIKVSQPRGRKDSIKNRDPNKQEVGFIFVWSGSELRSLIKIFKSEIKKFKTYSSWCPFQDLSSGITLMQIQWYHSHADPKIWPDSTFKDKI